MTNSPKRLAIIPARGGSKRLPRKNLLPFGNKPMLLWTIEAAKDSKVFDRVLVTTDDKDITSDAAGLATNAISAVTGVNGGNAELFIITGANTGQTINVSGVTALI